ncbi:unnamed protein product, partial [Amoebophrya sp. A25]|eukprot:GSA25T00007947001.1
MKSAAGGKGGNKTRKFVEIEQHVAVTRIIPSAFEQWDQLAMTLILGNQDLRTGFELFGVLGNRGSRPTLGAQKLEYEIHMLQDKTDIVERNGLENLVAHKDYSRRRGVNDLTSAEWKDVVVRDITELRFLERLMAWIPGLLKFYYSSKSFLMPDAPADDAYTKELEQCSTVIAHARVSWVLGVVQAEVIPYKKHLADISSMHQDFITTFVTRKETLLWLLTHTDGGAFDKKIRLVRPCTDDEVLLRALSNLSELRRVVSELFYKDAVDQVAVEAIAPEPTSAIVDAAAPGTSPPGSAVVA